MSTEGKVELSMEDAEKIKIEQGFPDADDSQMIDGKIQKSQILSLVRPCIEQLANEIERSFDFFREESHGERVDKIVLFGGGANLKGLTQFLQRELEINIEIGNALQDFKMLTAASPSEKNETSRLDLAIGAVLNKSDKINLLPVEVKEKTKRFVEHVSLQAVAVGVVVTMILSFIGLNIQLGAQRMKLKALKLEQTTLVPQMASLRMMFVADQIQGSHPHWEDALREISNAMQPKMYLTKLSLNNDVIHFKGIITQRDQGAQGILSNFMITLENGIFKDVSLVASKRETEGKLSFEFQISAEVE